MNPYVTDLLYAKTIRKAADVEMLNGRRYPVAGVKDVNEAENWVALYNPQVFGDNKTFRRIPLDLVSGVTVTNIDYDMGDE
jgi:hypothetical protein